jgi:ComF family protein
VKLSGAANVALAGWALAVWAPVAYEGPARELVKALKFHGATAVADAMAALIVAGAPEVIFGTSALVPVPLHPGRRRSRGFNQAEVLANAIARRTGLPVAPCLTRSGSNRTQVGRGRAARLLGPAGEIEVAQTTPAEAVLVDDVVTTGGTLAACAAALRAAGSKRVAAVAFARTAGR